MPGTDTSTFRVFTNLLLITLYDRYYLLFSFYIWGNWGTIDFGTCPKLPNKLKDLDSVPGSMAPEAAI